jgi:hypothetical protein
MRILRALLVGSLLALAAQAQAAPAIVQSASYANVAVTAPTFGASPTAGNLVILAFWSGSGNGVNTANKNGWTYIASGGVGSYKGAYYYRYVVGGDGTTYGWQGWSSGGGTASGSADIGIEWELSGVNAAWASALDATQIDAYTVGASTNTSTAITTAVANEMSLIAAFEQVGAVGFPASPTFTAGSYSSDQTPHGYILGSGAGDHKLYTSAASSTQYTVTWWASTPNTENVLMTIALKPPSSAVVARHKLLMQ